MALTKKAVGVIVILIVLSLSGLVALQSYLLNVALELKEQAFDRNVQAALNSVARKLETVEAMVSISYSGFTAGRIGDSATMTMKMIMIDDDSSLSRDIDWFSQDTVQRLNIWADDHNIYYNVPTPQHVYVQAFDRVKRSQVVLLDTFRLAGHYQLALPEDCLSGGESVFRIRSKDEAFVFESNEEYDLRVISDHRSDSGRHNFVNRVMDRMVLSEWEPITERINSEQLDSVIGATLAESGIDQEYVYGIVAVNNDSLVLAEPSTAAEQLQRAPWRARLFPTDIFAPRYDLALNFPDRAQFLWREIGPLLFTTVVLFAIIIGCFSYTVRTILVQKKLAARMVGFINNMTHEFKTPISTVALAAEAIIRPDIITQQDKVSQYTRMIDEENRRMRGQVEKILQMAVLEEGNINLELEPIEVHQLLRDTLESIRLQVTSRQGTIIDEFNAAHDRIRADRVHLTNIIHNLLDNALKYSPESPAIAVTTANVDGALVVAIRDRGMGLNDEDKKLVFDKYYRVASGNVHDVKGFGLGLSYVKLMTEAMGGRISLRSKIGRGTTIELSFPVLADRTGQDS